jgi:hypothetical protein
VEDLLNHGRKEDRHRRGTQPSVRRTMVPRSATTTVDEGGPGST